MRIPHKSRPDTPGRVIGFKKHKGAHEPWWHLPYVMANRIMATRIAVENFGYDTQPSVLILASSSSYLSGANSEQVRRFLGVTDPTRSTPYGDSREHENKFPHFSEAHFLSTVQVELNTSVHVTTFPDHLRDEMVRRTIQAARKFFDIVLLDASLPSNILDQSDLLFHYIPRTGEHKKERMTEDTKNRAIYTYPEALDAGVEEIRYTGDLFAFGCSGGEGGIVSAGAVKYMTEQIIEAAFDGTPQWLSFPEANEHHATAVLGRADIGSQSVAFQKEGKAISRTIESGFTSTIGIAALAIGLGIGIPELAIGGAGITSFGLSGVGYFLKRSKAWKRIELTHRDYFSEYFDLTMKIWRKSYNLHETLDITDLPILQKAGLTDFFRLELEEIQVANTPGSEQPQISLVKTEAVPDRSIENKTEETESLDTVELRLTRLRDKWMEYELNPENMLNYPLMSDATCAETAEFFLAMSNVDIWETAKKANPAVGPELSKAVLAAEKAFIKAEANAKKVRHSHLDEAQRKKIKDARPLVAMLSDENASPQEKVNAYRKAGDFLEGILALPERPIVGLLGS